MGENPWSALVMSSDPNHRAWTDNTAVRAIRPPWAIDYALETGHEGRLDLSDRIPVHSCKERVVFDFVRRVAAQTDFRRGDHAVCSKCEGESCSREAAAGGDAGTRRISLATISKSRFPSPFTCEHWSSWPTRTNAEHVLPDEILCFDRQPDIVREEELILPVTGEGKEKSMKSERAEISLRAIGLG